MHPDRLTGYLVAGFLAVIAVTNPATRLWMLIPLLAAAPFVLFPDE